MCPVGAGFRWGWRETIISSISLFSHFDIISMKCIHLQAVLRDWMRWMWFILCSPGCCVGVSDLTDFSLPAWGPDGICATHVPPNLSGTTLSRRTSFFQTTGKVLFMSLYIFCLHLFVWRKCMIAWVIDLCLALVCEKIEIVSVCKSVSIAAATTTSKQALHPIISLPQACWTVTLLPPYKHS